MRKVILSMKAQEQFQIIKRLAEVGIAGIIQIGRKDTFSYKIVVEISGT